METNYFGTLSMCRAFAASPERMPMSPAHPSSEPEFAFGGLFSCRQAGQASGRAPPDRSVTCLAGRHRRGGLPASDRAAFITGEVLNVAAGAYMRNWRLDLQDPP
jgi:hypothetical protein